MYTHIKHTFREREREGERERAEKTKKGPEWGYKGNSPELFGPYS